ncbi:MAG: hypothetical protein MJZ20_15170 [Bacteroidaceae bacterium]|nr:hypothetical protein [Bacteroidaceae bacterium]
MKKLPLLIVALALVLGLSQCKKQDDSVVGLDTIVQVPEDAGFVAISCTGYHIDLGDRYTGDFMFVYSISDSTKYEVTDFGICYSLNSGPTIYNYQEHDSEYSEVGSSGTMAWYYYHVLQLRPGDTNYFRGFIKINFIGGSPETERVIYSNEVCETFY